MYTSPDQHTPKLSTSIQTHFENNKKPEGDAWYIYSEDHILGQIKSLKKWNIPGGLTIRYAMKANPLKGIIGVMHSNGVQIDACSDYEVYRALASGVPAEHIQITGQTRPKNLKELISQGVKFCACSLDQLRKYGELFPGKTVGIRLNPGIGSGQFPGVNVGGHRSSFGVWHEYIPEINEIAKRYNLKITTLHTHIGSGSDPYIWQEVAMLSLGFVKLLPDITTLDLGGGFKVARMKDEKKADMELIGKKIAVAFTHFEEETGRQLHCEIEPGTYLVANSGYLGCFIDDIVDTGSEGEIFVKLTTGMSEIIRPIMYGARHPIRINSDNKESIKAIVVGHSCESSDMLTVDAKGVALRRELQKSSQGDAVLIGGVGAYCSSMCTSHYNSYPRVAEYLLTKNGSLICLRKEEKKEDVWTNEL